MQLKHQCKMCGKKFYGFGNNGFPVVQGIVCDSCNLQVIARRTELVMSKIYQQASVSNNTKKN